MKILISNEQDDLAIPALFFEKMVALLIESEAVRCDEIHLNFVDEKTITQLHADYFDDPTPTDCITFPIDDANAPYRLLGEVVVCPLTALKYTELHGGDVQEELMLYVIHGLLHLLGYDDIEEEDREAMRQAEAKMMNLVKPKFLNPRQSH